MRYGPLLLSGIATAAGLIWLSQSSAQSTAQKTPAASAPKDAQASASILNCEGTRILDPFKGKLAGPDLPPKLLPIDDKTKDSILMLRTPCQENVTPAAQGDPSGDEGVGLENLQRGFDFYSWRTFLAMNSPSDGTSIEHAQARTPAKWEQMDNFKQLLDVMLPPGVKEASWPLDKAGMEAERERLVPTQCSKEHTDHPEKMIVKMIEESFNEPFKTGPLIDQQGHYAIFDILMNRPMFDYIVAPNHHLNTKAGQMDAAKASLIVDFPPGQNSGSSLGAFMLKVSWKILSQSEIDARNFHMVDALVLMPKDERLPLADQEPKRPCLPETLGLIGFHAVHKTVNRPQWIWTSFEHIRNVPDRDQVAAKTFDGPFSFFDVNCKDDCAEVNATPPRQFWQPRYALKLSFEDSKFKSQIVRETPLTHATRNMNTIFQSMLQDSVWKNYMLVNTQWPTVPGCTKLLSVSADAPPPKNDFIRQPDMTCSPAPTFMANSTLETYSQGEIPQASSSCIGCHGNAVSFQTGASNQRPGDVRLNQSDFTFMLEKAQ
jgi:hypothetical protein